MLFHAEDMIVESSPLLALCKHISICLQMKYKQKDNETDLPPATRISPLWIDICGAAVPAKGSHIGQIPGPEKCSKEAIGLLL